MIKSAAEEEGNTVFPIVLLAVAGFSVVTTEFLIIGVLPSLARDLQVSVSGAGVLITLFAFTVAMVGPILTALLSRFNRKHLFVFALMIFAVANALAALAPNIGVMALARFIPALALPVFWSLASVTAIDLSKPEKAGQAVSIVNFGVVTATLFGIPAGTVIGDAFGWRSAFAILACLALVKALALFLFLPSLPTKTQVLSISTQIKILKSPLVFMHLTVSILLFTGMFIAYTYLADLLERLGGYDGTETGVALMTFGLVGLIGNWLGGKAVDWDPLGATLIFGVVLAVSLLALVPSIPLWFALAPALGIWGLAQTALLIICHVRLMKVGSQAPAFAASLNISAVNVGIGMGAIIGGYIVRTIGAEYLGVIGALAICVAVGLALSLMVERTNSDLSKYIEP